MLLRHGESTANAAGIFTGLLDVPLTHRGIDQADAAGRLRLRAGLVPDLVLTSTLHRTVQTAERVSDVLGRDIPTEALWQLNERNYGALTGMSKADARAELGEAAFSSIRRSRAGRPAAMPVRAWLELRSTPALRGLPAAAVRRTESLADVIDRVRPVLTGWALPALRAGRTVLVVSHGNSLRALCAVIDELTDTELEELNLPTGQPLLYRMQRDGTLSPRGGVFLDPTAAHDAAAMVAAEGGT
jgi:2,3-bisphosphoglycerate-dependent phosphoglycerate mutase